MTNKTLTKAENTAKRIGERKARDEQRRRQILDHYMGKVPSPKKQEPKIGDIARHYTKGKGER